MDTSNPFTEKELVLLSDLVGSWLETDDLNHVEWAEAKVLSEKLDGML